MYPCCCFPLISSLPKINLRDAFRSVFTIYVSCNPKRLDESNYQIVHSKRNENHKKMQIMVQYTYILLYSKAIIHKCGQCCSPPSSLSLERKMMDFPQRRYLEFLLSCVFLSLFFWFPIVGVVAFKQISQYCCLSAIVSFFSCHHCHSMCLRHWFPSCQTS